MFLCLRNSPPILFYVYSCKQLKWNTCWQGFCRSFIRHSLIWHHQMHQLWCYDTLESWDIATTIILTATCLFIVSKGLLMKDKTRSRLNYKCKHDYYKSTQGLLVSGKNITTEIGYLQNHASYNGTLRMQQLLSMSL